MKRYYSNILILMVLCISFGCHKHQYNGSHIPESHQHTLTDDHNNFHVRETKKVLAENEQRNDKREKAAHKNRKDQLRVHLANKKKKSLKFDIY